MTYSEPCSSLPYSLAGVTRRALQGFDAFGG
jgi:hypothetical protein